MFYSKYKLKSITGAELDSYLARGWYRMGLSIFTTHFLFFDDELYNAVWLRLPLTDYTFRKSLRRIKNKVESSFRVEFRPATFDVEKEKLFEAYKLQFKGILHSSLKTYMLDDEHYNVFDTMECCVYDGDKLIAFSFYDVGSDSIASILAAYDHNYASFSLGMYTMIAEVEFALEKNCSYYYPGYFVPGFTRFDYKCRIGETEYFNFYGKNWLPTEKFESSDNLAEQIKKRVYEVYIRLFGASFNAFVINYKNYELGDFYPEFGQLYNHPLFVLFEHEEKYFAIEYDLRMDHYRLTALKTPEVFRCRKNFSLYETIGVLNIYNLLECADLLYKSDDLSDLMKRVDKIFS